MNDDSFHLTPLDVRRYEFPNALRGYDKASVELFRERVYEELERLTKSHADLEQKAKNFHEQLRAFRERDKALNDALVAAQQLRAEIREQAEREAQLILREARAEGDRLIEQQRGEARRIQSELEGLERSRRAYLSQQRQLIERQLAELDAVASAPPPQQVPPSEPAPNEPPRRTHLPTPSWLDTLVKE
jgi:DivIVA domain-containing protein